MESEVNGFILSDNQKYKSEINMDEKKFKNLSFNDMPQAVEFLIDRILSMSEQIGVISEQIGHAIPDQWMTIDDLTKYLPDGPSAQTVYTWVGQKLVPYNKVGKRLYFLKSDIDNWLKDGRRKTAAEIAVEATARFEKDTTPKKK